MRKLARKLFNCPVVVLFLSLTSFGVTQAQNQTGENNAQLMPSSASLTTTANQNTISSLANLPDADTLIYINPQRILNEVVPKVMPSTIAVELLGVERPLKMDVAAASVAHGARYFALFDRKSSGHGWIAGGTHGDVGRECGLALVAEVVVVRIIDMMGRIIRIEEIDLVREDCLV